MFDVIVIGGGGAGLCAALAAHDHGAKVMIISKTPLGKANCTAFGGGGFTFAGPGTPWQDHYERTYETGRRINDTELLETFSREALERVSSLERFGVKLRLHPRGASVAPWAPNPTVGGMGLTLPLTLAVRNAGISVLEGQMVYRILTDDRRVMGVCAIDMATGRMTDYPAKAVILASGGGGRVFGRTNNPMRTTGDGYALIQGLGLPLRDMEFVQFYPIGLAEPELPVWFIGLHVIDDAPLTDSRGTEFLKALLPQWGLQSGREANLYARDRAAIAIAQKWHQGDEVWLHLDQMPAEKWSEPYYHAIGRLNRAGCDFKSRPVRVKPLEHYMSGGLPIKTDGSTELEGFYACGEVTGGIDGANRIGGNAFANITVFGLRAGEAAAEYCRGAASVGGSANSCALPEEVAAWSAQTVGPTPLELIKELRLVMDTQVGPIRCEDGLKGALEKIADLQQRLATVRVSTSSELRDALELRNMLRVCQMITNSALTRTESRGVHYRTDFPQEQADWQKPIIIS
ncbi:MAG: FAD-dependent oxidoreductase [Bacillota bacterium]